MEIIRTNLISIGKSQGIIIPKHALERLNLQDTVELIVNENLNELRIRSLQKVRQGWAAAFEQMHENGEDILLIDDELDLELLDW